MTALAAAIQFLLITPAFVRRTFTPAELGRSTAFYPLVGVILGSILAAADMLLAPIFSTEIRSALLMAIWIVMTGALHFDGLVDAVDGLLGGRTPERRMQIMRDERTGAYGVAAAGLILLTMFAALNSIHGERWPALLTAPLLGRCAISVCIACLPYGRREGLGRDIKDNTRPSHAAAALTSALAMLALIIWSTGQMAAAAALLAATVIGIIVSRFVLSRIGGMTGDTYGAICMLIELSVLLVFAVVP